MAGYFGTEIQQRLQALSEANATAIDQTPGAVQAGRMMGCDDPDRLGWHRIGEYLQRDGACAFRFLPIEKVDATRSRLADLDCRLDTWNTFVADRATALAACDAILAQPLPEGLVELDRPADPESGYTRQIQALMAEAGVVPFSGSMLTGAIGRATTVAIGAGNGTIAAAAHAYRPHNAHSPYRDHAWGGLVAVDDTQRGNGLGRYINARMVVSALRDLDASHVYEQVSATNIPSRRMVEACGLRLDPAVMAGIASPKESARFTR